jgi:SOS response associated peptidase (SRAP)
MLALARTLTGGYIRAMCGRVIQSSGPLRYAYRKRRCIMPVDGFFEWSAIKGQKAKQPYAIAMKDGAPFVICRYLGEVHVQRSKGAPQTAKSFKKITSISRHICQELAVRRTGRGRKGRDGMQNGLTVSKPSPPSRWRTLRKFR